MLRLMMTCHPRIVIPPEAGFLVDLVGAHGAFRGGDGELNRFVSDLTASPKFEHWKLPAAVVTEYLRATVKPADYASLVAGVYRCYASVHDADKPRWGDKNNFYLAHIVRIASLFPDAVFLHIVRDGRDVACSYRSLANVTGKYAPTLPSDILDAMFDWNRNLRRIRRAFARIGWKRVHELRYEDLVRDPEGTLRKVCGFLGEEFAPAMLEYDRENRTRELEPRDFDAWKRRNRDGIDASAIGRWANELSREEAELAQLAGDAMLRRYGYASGHPVNPRARLNYAGRVIAYSARRWGQRLRRRITRAASSSA